jgi:hypothetical protein
VLVLLIAGVTLVVFGAVVLLRFPDRPGGTISWHGIEVSSVGGGLPLIVVGIVAIAIASVRGPGGPDGPDGPSGPIGPVEGSPDSTTQERAEGGSAACFDQYFVNVPNDRIATLEEGAQDIDVIGPSQPKEGTVGIRLDMLGNPIGALRFQFFPRSGDVFKIESVVDARCRETQSFVNASRASDPRTLQNFDTLRIQLGGSFYELRLGGGSTIRLNFVRVNP